MPSDVMLQTIGLLTYNLNTNTVRKEFAQWHNRYEVVRKKSNEHHTQPNVLV